MGRRTTSIFRQIYSHAAFLLGISVPHPHRSRRRAKSHSGLIQRPNINNNSSRVCSTATRHRSDATDQLQLLCLSLDEASQTELRQRSRPVTLPELLELIRIKREDASTMTNTEHRTSSCSSLSAQSVSARRLKSLEFIRLFINMSQETFFRHLIEHEDLCERKASAVCQLIEQNLRTIHAHDQLSATHSTAESRQAKVTSRSLPSCGT